MQKGVLEVADVVAVLFETAGIRGGARERERLVMVMVGSARSTC